MVAVEKRVNKMEIASNIPYRIWNLIAVRGLLIIKCKCKEAEQKGSLDLSSAVLAAFDPLRKYPHCLPVGV
ncbi:hypothetical protein Y1Q_0007858 [Alligator mississippiensis]|uniref:Uncharacterized protein n=1 Tax=Alligator mississippiensis TaxID=8496 RepID=A0A151NEJ5_ALLMI|nr:hypothetical protein Y1Q_0007858 [Alligator mississippiensis]